MTLALSLDERRRRAKLGVTELARKARLSRTTVWRVMTGRRDAYGSTLRLIEAAIAAEERALAASLAASMPPSPREAA